MQFEVLPGRSPWRGVPWELGSYDQGTKALRLHTVQTEAAYRV